MITKSKQRKAITYSNSIHPVKTIKCNEGQWKQNQCHAVNFCTQLVYFECSSFYGFFVHPNIIFFPYGNNSLQKQHSNQLNHATNHEHQRNNNIYSKRGQSVSHRSVCLQSKKNLFVRAIYTFMLKNGSKQFLQINHV